MKNSKKIAYILSHRRAFLSTQRQLLGRTTLSGYLHDLDKVVLLLMGINPKTASRVHRVLSSHHTEGLTVRQNYTDMVIDWQCASLTKPDKPLDARQTCARYYPQLADKITPICDKLNI